VAILFDELLDGGGDLYFDDLSAAPITGDEPQIVTVGTLRYLGNATITGSNFGASQGAGGVAIGGVAQPIVSWGDTSITIGPIARGILRYGTQSVVVTSDADGSSNPSAQPLLPQAGWNYVNLVNPLATSGARITASPDLAGGDQLAWGDIIPSGTVTVASDASYLASSTVGQFNVECNDGTGWGGFGTQFVANVAALSGVLAAAAARLQGSFAVQVPSTARTFSGTLRAGNATLSGTFLAFRSRAFSGSIEPGAPSLQGAFFVIGAVTPTPAPPTPAPGTGTPEARVAIANMAIVKLGSSNTIRSFTDDSKNARVMSQIFDRVRDRELAKYIWKFALCRRNMPEFVSDEPRGGYRYVYTKPIDWLHTVWIGDLTLGTPEAQNAPHDADWSHEGEYILTNFAPPIPLQYIRRISDPTKYHVLFSEALACSLAMEACEAITGSTSKWEARRLEYREAVAEARRASAILDPPRFQSADSWLDARN
jgi:hypothetical protein